MQLIGLTTSLVFVGIFLIFPETPQYLMSIGSKDLAEKSVIFYKKMSDRKSVDNILNSYIKTEQESSSIQLSELRKYSYYYSIIIIVELLVILNI